MAPDRPTPDTSLFLRSATSKLGGKIPHVFNQSQLCFLPPSGGPCSCGAIPWPLAVFTRWFPASDRVGYSLTQTCKSKSGYSVSTVTALRCSIWMNLFTRLPPLSICAILIEMRTTNCANCALELRIIEIQRTAQFSSIPYVASLWREI